jgi:hypothetical protein
MGYDVKLSSLRGYTLTMTELGNNVNPHLYVQANAQLEVTERGLFGILSPVHDRIVKDVVDQNKKIYGYDALLYRSAHALDDAARLYADNDDDARARLQAADRSIGEVHRPITEDLPPLEKNLMGLPGHYHDPLQGDANRLLRGGPTTPESDDNPDDPLGLITKKVDWLSPSHWINKGIESLTGHNPFGEISEAFGGDWKAWWRCSDVWRRVGGTHALVAHEVWRGNARLDLDWDGNAADSAYAYFHKLAFTLKSLKQPYDKLWNLYRTAALHVSQAAGVVTDLLNDLGDKAIILGLSRTGVGKALLEAYFVKEAMAIIKKIQQVVLFVKSLLGGVANTLSGVLLLMTNLGKQLPEPYAMPAAYQRAGGN